MEFLLLGPLEAAEGKRTVRLGPPRQRAVLAMLALGAPDVVSTDRLVDGLWGDEPTSNPLGTLQVYVHGVRKALRQVSKVELVERVSPGYRLAITSEQTDIGRFTSLQRRARDERLRGETAVAAATLEEALSLWRGPALADVRGAPFAEPEAVRLEELRLMAEEDSYDVQLALGEHAALVAELDRAVLEHPVRERFWGQLMTALYRSDRQADALATYARARTRLADELGIDPGQALQQLEVAILRQDPDLAAPSHPPPPSSLGATEEMRVALATAKLPAVAPRDPARVPRTSTPIFGRRDLVARIRDLLSEGQVRSLTLTGPGGSGKSRVAAVAAATVAVDFEGRVVHLTATERTDQAQLARELTLAVTGTDDEAALGRLDSRILVVLDNLESIASGGRLVHDLVERTSCLTVLSTSRLPLHLRAEYEIPVPPLEVPREDASADEIAAAPAVEMFVDRALAVAPGFRLQDHADDVADLCRFLDGLPLAIELAAAHARLLTPAQIRSALKEDLGLLTAHASYLPERQQTLAATIEWSYDRLDPAARTVADRLALFERGFTVEAVEAVCDDVPDVLAALAQIVEARLIRPADSRVEVRFVALGTVRAYARTRLQHQDDLETRRIALADHLLARARAWAGQLDGPEGPTVVGRYDDTAADLDAVLDWATATGRTDLAVELTTTITELWIASGRLTDGLRRTQRLRSCRHPSEEQAEALDVGVVLRHLADDAAAWITQTRSANVSTSSSSVEISRTATPSAAAARSRAVMYSMAPTSRPRVGWAATSTRRFGRQLAGQHDALLVAARQRPHRRLGRARPWISNACISSFARASIALRSSRPRLAHRGEVGQHEVLGDGQVEHAPRVVAILGDDADAGGAERARLVGHAPLPADEHLTVHPTDQAGQDVGERPLAVALDAGEPDDLAAAHRDRQVVEQHAARRGRARWRRGPRARPAPRRHASACSLARHLGHRLDEPEGGGLRPQRHRSADHRLGQRRRGRRRGGDAVDDPPAAHDRDLVGGVEDLVELVRHQRHGALLLDDDGAQHREQLLALGRREHARRLVEDDDLGLPPQALDDLDPLALAGGEAATRWPAGRRRARSGR